MKKERRMLYFKIIIFSILVIVLIALIMTFSKFEMKDVSYESKNIIFGEHEDQTVYSTDGERIAFKVTDTIKKFESLTLSSGEESEIFKINSNGSKIWTDISDSTMDILSTCMDIASRSSGAFDPTIKSVLSLWGFDTGDLKVPSNQEIKRVLKSVDYKSLKVNKDVKRAKLFDDSAAITLDFALKGSACDIAIDQYKKLGAKAAIISIGRSIGVFGKKSSNKPWNIAIHDPFKPAESMSSLAVMKITEGCVSTLAVSDRSFEINSKKYHSILDPKTGYPKESDLVSVTILHESGLIADALSNACYVLGREKSVPLLNYYGAGAVLVDRNKNVFLNQTAKNIFTLSNNDCSIEDM